MSRLVNDEQLRGGLQDVMGCERAESNMELKQKERLFFFFFFFLGLLLLL
jgi:hypothetical protein